MKLSEEERLDRRERRHKRKLAHDVSHHGYRAVARRVHPDVGGNADDMRWLREVCDVLHAAVTSSVATSTMRMGVVGGVPANRQRTAPHAGQATTMLPLYRFDHAEGVARDGEFEGGVVRVRRGLGDRAKPGDRPAVLVLDDPKSARRRNERVVRGWGRS